MIGGEESGPRSRSSPISDLAVKSILVSRTPTEGRQSVPLSDLRTPVYLTDVAKVVQMGIAARPTSNEVTVRMFNDIAVDVLLDFWF